MLCARITEILEHKIATSAYHKRLIALECLQMGDDGEEGSTKDGYHSLTLHSVASSAAHHTGNPFAAGNTPRISVGESSTLLATPSSLAFSASSSTMVPRTSAPQGERSESQIDAAHHALLDINSALSKLFRRLYSE